MDLFSSFKPQEILSVSQLTSHLRTVLESDELLQDLWVQGEISNFARPASGHLYFTLKDSDASVRCVMWRQAASRLNFSPEEGLAVEAHGGMGVYEVSGQVQLYIDTLKPAGEGALYQEYLRLKARLEAEGLFDAERKVAIPPRPKLIGIVTSATGAALQDMLNTLSRRYPIAEVVVAPTAVQGTDAPPAIVAALARLEKEIQPDVILIGRGGGSIEDLWAFNDETVVRAVADAKTPIISGVGHETDFTLTDFAADLRAPTPTAAAELAVPDKNEILNVIADLKLRHELVLNEVLAYLRQSLNETRAALSQHSPVYAVNSYRQSLDETGFRLDRAVQNLVERKSYQLANLQQSLKSLNPQAVLNRGYAIVTRLAEGSVIKRADQTSAGDAIHIQVSRGNLEAKITKTNPGGTK